MGELEIRSSSAGGHYVVAVAIRSVGLIDWIVDYRTAVRSEGRDTGADTRSTLHRADNRAKGKARWVELRYGGDGRVDADADPPPKEDERSGVPASIRNATVDPMTAAWLAFRAARSIRSITAAGAMIFSPLSRRRRVVHRPRPATVCDLWIEPNAGFSKRPWFPAADVLDRAKFWLADICGTRFSVWIEADAQIGSLVIRLIALDGRVLAEPAASPAPRAEDR